MKRQTVDYWVAQLYKFTPTVPAPFPGKWPTHLVWQIRQVNPDGTARAVLDSYCGKPSRSAIRRFAKLAAKGDWLTRCTIIEHDRKNVIAAYSANGRVNVAANGFRLMWTQQNNTLWYAYHPWDLRRMLYMFMVPQWLKNVAGWRVYSPAEHLTLVDHVNPFKLWLRARKYVK